MPICMLRIGLVTSKICGRPGNNCRILQGQVLMIEYIECLPAELQIEPFGHRKVLGQ